MPGKISDCKGGEIRDGVYISDISSLSAENEIAVSSETTNVKFIVFVILIILLVLLVFIMLLREK